MPSKLQFCNSLFRTIFGVATAILATVIVFVLIVFFAPTKIGLDSQCSLQFSKTKGGSKGSTDWTSTYFVC